jgi:hypothetical protein
MIYPIKILLLNKIKTHVSLEDFRPSQCSALMWILLLGDDIV